LDIFSSGVESRCISEFVDAVTMKYDNKGERIYSILDLVYKMKNMIQLYF